MRQWRANGGFPWPSPEERFWSKVNKDGPVPDYAPHLGPCWMWLGAPKQEGYGDFLLHGKVEYAHRVAYEWLVRPIPDGLQIDHLCRVRICVNPAHLEPVPSRVNTMRGDNPRLTSERGRSKTHCDHGHEFTEANTYWHEGHRKCKACFAERTRARLAKRKGIRDTPGFTPPTWRQPCKQGHEVTGDNLYVDPWGIAHCRACRQEAGRASRARAKAG